MVSNSLSDFNYRSPYFEIKDHLVVLAEEQKTHTLSEASGDILLVWVACLRMPKGTRALPRGFSDTAYRYLREMQGLCMSRAIALSEPV